MRYVTILGLILTLGQSNLACAEIGQTASVEILPLTITGESLPMGRVDLLQLGTNRSFRNNFRGWRGANIPYGEYRLRIQAPGFRIHEQTLRVFQPAVHVRVGLRVTLRDDEPIREIQGSITPAKSGGKSWVKLVPILADGPAMDTQVLQDGTFAFAGFDPGDYLLVVIRGMTVIHTEQTKLFGGEKIQIHLPLQKP